VVIKILPMVAMDACECYAAKPSNMGVIGLLPHALFESRRIRQSLGWLSILDVD